ncbi:hypothetical protein [Thermocatellispora tengchongensis]
MFLPRELGHGLADAPGAPLVDAQEGESGAAPGHCRAAPGLAAPLR